MLVTEQPLFIHDPASSLVDLSDQLYIGTHEGQFDPKEKFNRFMSG